MSQNYVVVTVYPDRLEVSRVPMVRARIEPLKVVVRWLDDETWNQVSVGDFVRVDKTPIETEPPDPLFRHTETDPVQDVNFRKLETEDVGASYEVVARSSAKKVRLQERFECLLLGFET